MDSKVLADALSEKLTTQIKRNGLQSELDSIVASARPSYLISRGRGSRVKLGASHFGGLPHIPDGFDWPVDSGELMTFVAQINLSDLTDGTLGLPDSGWLAFFVGGAEATGSESVVAYFSDDAEISEFTPPEGVAFRNDRYLIGDPTNGVFPATPVKFKLSPSLAPFNLHAYDDDDIIDAYIDLHGDLSVGLSHLRGNPYCDGDCIDFDQFSKHKDWTLLLQVDSFDPVEEMCWWDNGKLCFLIRETDLKKRRFSKAIAYLAAVG